MKKVSKYLIQASCVVIFFALFCGASDCHNSDCDNTNYYKYVIKATVRNNSDKQITVNYYVTERVALNPGEYTQKTMTWTIHQDQDDGTYSFNTYAYLGDATGKITVGELDLILLGKKVTVLSEFSESVDENGINVRYAECVIEYPW